MEFGFYFTFPCYYTARREELTVYVTWTDTRSQRLTYDIERNFVARQNAEASICLHGWGII